MSSVYPNCEKESRWHPLLSCLEIASRESVSSAPTGPKHGMCLFPLGRRAPLCVDAVFVPAPLEDVAMIPGLLLQQSFASARQNDGSNTTPNNGSLGSQVDEERSKLREIRRIAGLQKPKRVERIWHSQQFMLGVRLSEGLLD
jgi:hypothetical protein